MQPNKTTHAARNTTAQGVVLMLAASLQSACSGQAAVVSDSSPLTEELESEEETFEGYTLLHQSFAPDTTLEEADTRFDVAVSDYMASSVVRKGRHHEWNFRLCTTTGRVGDAGTDDNARLRISFLTDLGSIRYYHYLDHSGDDREFGQVDCYLIEGDNLRDSNVAWVEIQRARLQLEGTDGWFVERFTVDIKPSDQTDDATGRAFMDESPRQWLDNESENIFATGPWDSTFDYSGANDGRLSF
jgi:hypothetical protein